MEITMSWTELTRRQHDRKGDKYASDMNDAEWALIAPSMPPPKTTGRPRTTCLREVVDALLYIATTGCQWRMLACWSVMAEVVTQKLVTVRSGGVLKLLDPVFELNPLNDFGQSVCAAEPPPFLLG
jgi:hypothetical protein